MNKEDYEDLESYLIMEQTGKIGRYAPRGKYWKEINWIAKKLDISVRRIGILEDTVDGYEWVMIDGNWRGDLVEWEKRWVGILICLRAIMKD